MWIKIKKTYYLLWILGFTLWCAFRIYLKAWFSGPAKSLTHNAKMTRKWGDGLSKKLRVPITFKGSPISSEPTLFLGNHMSYLDIPVFYTLRNATFVAKKEVSKWPVFGVAATSVGTVYVDRESVTSRHATTGAMKEAIKDRKQSIVIFPEGTSSLQGKPWKQGALRLAEEAGFWVQPFTLYYHPARTAAYIDDDHLLPHLWNWIGTTKIEVTIHFFDPIKISDYKIQTKEIEQMVQQKWQELHSEHAAQKN